MKKWIGASVVLITSSCGLFASSGEYGGETHWQGGIPGGPVSQWPTTEPAANTSLLFKGTQHVQLRGEMRNRDVGWA